MKNVFIYDVEKHETLKQAAIYSYDVENNQIPKGYTLIKTSKPSETGFYACALKKGNEVIIAYRGTDEEKDGDWTENNFKLAKKQMPAQRREAIDFCSKIMQENNGCEFYVAGHSLGGALAQIVGAFFNLNTATFNAAGVDSMLKRDNLKSCGDKIINYHTPNDFIKKIFWMYDDIGTSYVVESYAHPLDFWGHHSAENMKPLRTAVPMMRDPHKSFQEYKDIAKDGVNKVKTTIGNAVENVKRGQTIGFAASANECPGTYYVEGYKRADGKEVAGYYRSCSVHGNSGGIRKKRIDEMTQQELDDLLERIL